MASNKTYLDNLLSRRAFFAASGLLLTSAAFAKLNRFIPYDTITPKYTLNPIGRTFTLSDYFIWCSSPIWGEDGKVHLFYSRWKKEKGMGGWLRGSEIGHAIADNPFSEFADQGTVLVPREGAWDSTTCHNPLIKVFDGTYYLYYMGNSNGKTDTKRIGVAVSSSLDGPWERLDRPILEAGTEGSWDDHCTTNPAVVKGYDGHYWLFYKSWNTGEYQSQSGAVRGNRKYGLARSSSPTGPFVKVATNPIIDFSELPNNAQLEDAFVWTADGSYHMIARDMGFFNHEYGLYLTSKDGLSWTLPTVSYLDMHSYTDEENPSDKLKRFGRLERPMFLLENNEGRPQYLFGATQGGAYATSTCFVFKVL